MRISDWSSDVCSSDLPRGSSVLATTRDGRKLTVLLAIDVGNTNAKFALFRGEELLARWRIATDDRRTADEYMVWLDQLMRIEGHDRAGVTAVIISTVVPRALHNLQLLAHKYFGVDALVRTEEHT